MFGIGLILFVLGVLSVFTDIFSNDDTVAGPQSRGNPSLEQPRALGPASGESIPAYIETKKAALAEKGSKEPRANSYAVVSFDAYKKGAEAAEVAGAFNTEATHLQMRIPLPGFFAETVELKGRTIEEAVADATGEDRIEVLTKEVEELEQILKDTQDPEYKAVYQEDARSRRQAIQLLKSDPPIVFALVIQGTNANLVKVAAAPGVRLVDIPADPAATPRTHFFPGILPEDT